MSPQSRVRTFRKKKKKNALEPIRSVSLGASGGGSAAAKCVTAKCRRRNLLAGAVFPVSCDIQQAMPVNNPESCHHGHRSVFVLGWGGGEEEGGGVGREGGGKEGRGGRLSFLVSSSVLMSLHDNRATGQHLVVFKQTSRTETERRGEQAG